jgi:hypothetical protein
MLWVGQLQVLYTLQLEDFFISWFFLPTIPKNAKVDFKAKYVGELEFNCN